ncbi:MAG: YbaN family protein [Planctomycetota bacterium]
MSDDAPTPPATTGLARWCLLVLGVVFTVLGAVGAFLPVLPTTPFLLLASACFVRSSPAFHRRLLANRVFGPYLRQWQRDRTVPPDAKRKAYGLVLVTFTLSIVLVDRLGLRVMLAVLGLALLAFLAWLPATAEGSEEPPAESG